VKSVIDRGRDEHIETFSGVLREIDLDAHSFVLREVREIAQEVHCTFPETLLETAKDALDKPVQVTGSRILSDIRRATAVPLVVNRIEILGDEPSES